MSSSPLTVQKFNEKEIGREVLRRWKEIEDPERKQKEWAVEKTKKQEKAEAVKVSNYVIKCVCSSLMEFLFFLALPCCSLESFKGKQCNFKYHAFF